VDAAFRAVELKVAITRWLYLHQKEGLFKRRKEQQEYRAEII
jgi:hypothetical protein